MYKKQATKGKVWQECKTVANILVQILNHFSLETKQLQDMTKLSEYRDTNVLLF